MCMYSVDIFLISFTLQCTICARVGDNIRKLCRTLKNKHTILKWHGYNVRNAMLKDRFNTHGYHFIMLCHCALRLGCVCQYVIDISQTEM